MIGRRALGAVVAFGAMCALAAPAHAGEGRIVYSGQGTVNTDIYTIAGDGTDSHRLTDDPAFDQFPSLSPDGRRIAWMSTREGNAARIWVMNVDGSGAHPVTVQPADDPSWSPDGGKLAFVRHEDLWVLDLTAGPESPANPAVNVTKGVDRLPSSPSWSPDGTRLAYDAVSASGNGRVYILDLASGARTELTHASFGHDFDPDWSPDGSQVAYVSTNQGTLIGVWVVNVDGTDPHFVAVNGAGDPSWSPDGSRIAYGVTELVDGVNTADIYSIRPDRTDRRRITADAKAEHHPDWGPDFTATADVAVELADDPDPVLSGRHVSYRVIVRNRGGNSAATGVRVRMTLEEGASSWDDPAGCATPDPATLDCPVGILPPGVTAGITRTVEAPDGVDRIVVRARVSGDGAASDPDPSNDEDLDETAVIADGDRDGVGDASDNCPFDANSGQDDRDGDGLGDACDVSSDGDEVPDAGDNCPDVPNEGQSDVDGDGLGDACDPDIDGDGVSNGADNCGQLSNADQADSDGDGLGDACDGDRDGDARVNESDNCPDVPNPGQEDSDGDGLGDDCDADADADGVADVSDNCRLVPNVDQADADGDGQGDACDADTDGDGAANESDNCPNVPNADQRDTDGNGIGDACDSEQPIAGELSELIDLVEARVSFARRASLQIKLEHALERLNAGNLRAACGSLGAFAAELTTVPRLFISDADRADFFARTNRLTARMCSGDIDGDAVPDVRDNCPDVPNGDQRDSDGDRAGDACDPDRDGDGTGNESDNCPNAANPGQEDRDGDAAGDPCDPDRDGDALANEGDNCADTPNADQADADRDGVGDACDTDSDGDGVPNASDNCVAAPNSGQADADGDGAGDACDPDLDGDGRPNAADNCPGLANPGQADTDADGVGDACDTSNPLAGEITALIEALDRAVTSPVPWLSLRLKLVAARTAVNRSDYASACASLSSFTSELQSLSGRWIHPRDRAALIERATFTAAKVC